MTPKQPDRANAALDRIKDAVRRIEVTWPGSSARRRAELDHEQACAAMRAVLGEVEASEADSDAWKREPGHCHSCAHDRAPTDTGTSTCAAFCDERTPDALYLAIGEWLATMGAAGNADALARPLRQPEKPCPAFRARVTANTGRADLAALGEF